MREERLKRVADIRVSNVDKKSVDNHHKIRLCNYTDVYYNERITGALDFMTATATPDQCAAFGLKRGDVVLTKDSETAEDVGVSALVADDVPGLVCGYHLAIVRARTGRALGEYLRWVLASGLARQRMSAAATGVTRFGLRSEAIADLPVPVPPIAMQRKIAAYLDRETHRIDALIAAKRRMVELVEHRFVRFVQSLVDPDARFADGGLIPLKYVAKIERGVFSHRPRNDPAFYDGPYPFIQTGDVARAAKYVEAWTQTLNDRGLAVSRRFPAGTLTMVIAANIGDVGITTFEACFPDSIVAIEARASVLDTNYLYFGLLAAKRRLVEMAPVTTQGNLNVERIGSLVVRCPSLQEQRAIADRLDTERQRVDRVASREGRSIDLLQERRHALVTAAVTGELEIPEAA